MFNQVRSSLRACWVWLRQRYRRVSTSRLGLAEAVVGVIFVAVVRIATGLATLCSFDGELVVVGSGVTGSGVGVSDSDGVAVGVSDRHSVGHGVGHSVGHAVGDSDGS